MSNTQLLVFVAVVTVVCGGAMFNVARAAVIIGETVPCAAASDNGNVRFVDGSLQVCGWVADTAVWVVVKRSQAEEMVDSLITVNGTLGFVLTEAQTLADHATTQEAAVELVEAENTLFSITKLQPTPFVPIPGFCDSGADCIPMPGFCCGGMSAQPSPSRTPSPSPSRQPCITSSSVEFATDFSYCQRNCDTRYPCLKCCAMFNQTLFGQMACRQNCTEKDRGFGVDDPHFVGFRGQRFDFMGRAGEVFNLVSDKHLQFNAEFAGRPSTTYFLRFGIQLPHEQIRIACDEHLELKSKTFDYHVSLNGNDISSTEQEIPLFEQKAVLSVRRLTGLDRKRLIVNSQSATVEDSPFVELKFEQYRFHIWFGSSPGMPCFLNLDSKYRDDLTSGGLNVHDDSHHNHPHGILGQTVVVHGPTNHGTERIATSDKMARHVIEGTWRDYVVAGKDLFGTDFRFNRYQPPTSDITSGN